MSRYKHITIEERESILKFTAENICISEIARRLNRNKSSISREINRNKNRNGYSPHLATKKYNARRKNCGRKAILTDKEKSLKVRNLILENQWSPEQISNRLKLEGGFSISYATIYRSIKLGHLNIKPEKKTKGKYPIQRKLRRKGRRNHKEETRGKIKISNPIEERPISATNRSRFGHWEADTVCGKKSKSCLVTLVDRKSRFLAAGKAEKQLDQYVKNTMVKLLLPYINSNKLRSITPDRGKEFTSHKYVSTLLGNTPFYFANAHSPWERGTNENTNGLLREYIPKRLDIDLFSEDDIDTFVKKLNLRPRKCLAWKTPFEVFFNSVLHLT